MVKNLSQLKKKIKDKKEFRIVDHPQSENIGQIRKPTIIRSNGFYSNRPYAENDNDLIANDGNGLWCHYQTARNWHFNNGICSLYTKEKEPKLVVSFVFLDDHHICCLSCANSFSKPGKTFDQLICMKTKEMVEDDAVCEEYN